MCAAAGGCSIGYARGGGEAGVVKEPVFGRDREGRWEMRVLMERASKRTSDCRPLAATGVRVGGERSISGDAPDKKIEQCAIEAL